MLTISHKRALDADDVLIGKFYIEGSCLSTDEKPTNVKNGSRLLVMDTSAIYVFDEANLTWLECTAAGGGGGSGIDRALYFDGDGKSMIAF